MDEVARPAGGVRAVGVDDLRAVAEAAAAVAAAKVALCEAVAAARAQGRSWARIADALGVSRQAARQRFGLRSLE